MLDQWLAFKKDLVLNGNRIGGTVKINKNCNPCSFGDSFQKQFKICFNRGCSPKIIISHFDKILLPKKKQKKMVVAATKFQHLKIIIWRILFRKELFLRFSCLQILRNIKSSDSALSCRR
jgi:hypothetical protein